MSITETSSPAKRMVIKIKNGRAVVGMPELIERNGVYYERHKKVARGNNTLRKEAIAQIRIDKGIPIPQKAQAGKRITFHVEWARRCEVGDSFYIPGISVMQGTDKIQYWTEATGFRFVVRAWENGVRFWRVK